MYRFVGSLLIVFAVMQTSCAPLRPKLGKQVDSDFAAVLMAGWMESAATITSVQGLARFNMKAPLSSMNGTQVLIAEKPDRMRAETLSPFGTPLLTVIASEGELGILLPAENVFYICSATSKNLGEFLHIPMESADLVNAVLYQPPLIDAWDEEVFELRQGGWLLIRHGTLRRQELQFDQNRTLIDVAYYENNDLKARLHYAKFSGDQRVYPEQLTIELPEKHATVSIDFTDVEINGRIRPGLFELQAPAGARTVYLPD